MKPVELPGRHPHRDRLRSGDPGGRGRAVLGERRDRRWRTGSPTPASRRRGGTTPRNFTSCCRRAATAPVRELVAQPRRLHWRHGLARSLPRPGWAAWPAPTSAASRPPGCWRSRGTMRERSTPKRLGAVGPELFPDRAYATSSGDGVVRHRTARRDSLRRRGLGRRERETCGCSSASTARRSPATSMRRATSARSTCSDAGLRHTVAEAPKDKNFAIRLNITTPYMPITSDGKEPDLAAVPRRDQRRGGEGGAQGATPRTPRATIAEGCRARQSRRRHRRRQRRGRLPLQRAPVVLSPAAHRHGRDRQGTEDRQLHRASSPTTKTSTARSR